MVSVIEELKAHARVLHRQAEAGEATALARLGLQPERSEAQIVQRRHCLAAIARELGFAGWPHAVAVLSGTADDQADFGTLLYPWGGAAHTNIWCRSYAEAAAIRAQTHGYLLAYKRQYFIVDRYFILALGLDPDAAEWQEMGRDWVRPARPEARQRLYQQLIRAHQS